MRCGDLVVSVDNVVAETPHLLAQGLREQGLSQSGKLVVVKVRGRVERGDGGRGVVRRVVTFFFDFLGAWGRLEHEVPTTTKSGLVGQSVSRLVGRLFGWSIGSVGRTGRWAGRAETVLPLKAFFC